MQMFLLCIVPILLLTVADCQKVYSAGDHQHLETSEDYILCRGCGSDISSTKYLIHKLSPASIYAVNDTLFNRDKVLIQVFSNYNYLRYAVVTVGVWGCANVGEWNEEESWFPGYRWKVCMCPHCRDFLGWTFEPINPDLSGSQMFTALILPNLISESCKYCYNFFGGALQSLIKSPSLKTDYQQMASTDNMSSSDKEFLAKCEEELKNRYTDDDEEFMKVFKAEPSVPPIIESWWVPQNAGRRNDRRNNRRNHPYERNDRGDQRDRRDQRGYRDYDRGYNDHHRDRGYGSRNQRPRY